MGLFDSLKHAFGHHGHGKRVGEPLTLADAKALLASIVVRQQLADMRKVADAVKQLQDELPQYATFGMSHYYSEPKRVRFQSEGGRFIDADAIATAYATSTIVRDECEIQHLMGDIADNREHRDPATTPAVPIDDLLRATAERPRPGADDRSSARLAVRPVRPVGRHRRGDQAQPRPVGRPAVGYAARIRAGAGRGRPARADHGDDRRRAVPGRSERARRRA